jgi:hypothetical protein
MNRVVCTTLIVSLGIAAVAWRVWRHVAEPPADSEATQAQQPPNPAPETAPNGPLVFRAADLPFQYERGDSGAAWPVEPVGGGVGIADFDGDGRPDLFFAQGVPLSEQAPHRYFFADVLLRNTGEQQFEDVSAAAELNWKGYGVGVAVADFDGDGFPDVYVTRYGANTLWQNLADGTFRDVTEAAGVGCELWSLGAAFADVDGDGDLDLFVANYFTFDPADAPFARDPVTGAADYGAPARFDGQPDVLYRNDGSGRFQDVTSQSGIEENGRGMGVLAADFDRDGRMDIFVANDAQNNALWHNLGDGRFEDVAIAWGVAVNARGQTEANMGIAYGDTDGDGFGDFLVSHLVNEHDTLWCARPARDHMLFRDETFEAGLGLDSRPYTGWGTALADFDHDGRLDLIVANGHIRREMNQPYLYENPPILWHNLGTRFANVRTAAGPYFRATHIARGLAAGDLDNDGDVDLVVVHHHKPSVVLWNESPRAGAGSVVQLRGSGFNRDAVGARLVARSASRAIVRTIDGGGSYLSANDTRVHFGFGPAEQVDELEVHWPTGRVETWHDLPVNQLLRVDEGSAAP